jgi:hypothetical protein
MLEWLNSDEGLMVDGVPNGGVCGEEIRSQNKVPESNSGGQAHALTTHSHESSGVSVELPYFILRTAPPIGFLSRPHLPRVPPPTITT